MKRRTLSMLSLLLCFSVLPMKVQAQDTDITVGVIAKEPQYENTHLKIENEHAFPIADAILYMKENGVYLPIGKSGEDGCLDFYLCMGDTQEIMIQCQGYVACIQRLHRNKEVEQSVNIHLARNGPYQDYEVAQIQINGLFNHVAEESFSFHLANTGMENETPVCGDIRFSPKTYAIKDVQGSMVIEQAWTHAIQPLKIQKAGSYTLHIEFQMQRYEHGSWKDMGDLLEHVTSFTITQASSSAPNNHAFNQPFTSDTGNTSFAHGIYYGLSAAEIKEEQHHDNEVKSAESHSSKPIVHTSAIEQRKVAPSLLHTWWWLLIPPFVILAFYGIHKYKKKR